MDLGTLILVILGVLALMVISYLGGYLHRTIDEKQYGKYDEYHDDLSQL